MKTNNEEKETFWIAYADLMAGLLFVFVLLVGGIIVKYFLTQSNLQEKESQISSALASLQSQEKKSAELEALNKIFSDQLEKLNIENTDLRKQNSIYFIQIEDLTEMAEKLKKENLDINSLLQKARDDANATISQKELKIAFLLDQLTQKESDFNKILQDLNKGSSELKEGAKEALRSTLQSYFAVLLNNDEIRENLDQIIIEGHTDSDGGYLYNLELSQNRAFAVMDFINSWNKDERLQKYLIASGRSYTQPVMRRGVEDKDASRRIEIKFTLSNKEAMEEIRKFLQFDANATN